MRIIQATDYGSPFPGSFVPMLIAAMGEAEARGWKAQVVLPARARDREWLSLLDDFESQVVFAPQASRRALGRWLARFVAEEDVPTVLHSHFSVADYAVARIARRRREVRGFWHLHTVLGDHPRARLVGRYKLAIASRSIERILCVAPHLAEAVIRRGAPADKVLYFPNALDTRGHSPATPRQRQAARELLGLPQESIVLLHFGRAWLAKGGDLFLEAVRLLRDSGADVVALCARGGEPAEQLANRLGMSDAVFTQDRAHTYDLYAAADVLVSTSRGEGMPLTVLEALASGVPVVASDIPGHEVPGADLPSLTIVPLDPVQVANAVQAHLDLNEATAAERVDRSGRWLVENMDVKNWARRLMDLYEVSPTGESGPD